MVLKDHHYKNSLKQLEEIGKCMSKLIQQKIFYTKVIKTTLGLSTLNKDGTDNQQVSQQKLYFHPKEVLIM